MKDPSTNIFLQTLMKCITACEHCANACLDEPDTAMLAECIRLDRDCADICTLTARYIGRGSMRAGDAVRLCADICRKCADECRHHDHAHCRKCAQVCIECHEQCEAYLAEHAVQHTVP